MSTKAKVKVRLPLRRVGVTRLQAEAEQSGVSAEPVIPPPADNTATSPVPFSPATLRKAGKKTAPPPVISKRPVTGGHTPPVAPKVAKSISKPEICIDTSPKHSKTEGDHNTHGALAVQSGGTPSPFDFDAMKKSIMSEVREQVEEFTKDLLAGPCCVALCERFCVVGSSGCPQAIAIDVSSMSVVKASMRGFCRREKYCWGTKSCVFKLILDRARSVEFVE